jgi:hypothetical protein
MPKDLLPLLPDILRIPDSLRDKLPALPEEWEIDFASEGGRKELRKRFLARVKAFRMITKDLSAEEQKAAELYLARLKAWMQEKGTEEDRTEEPRLQEVRKALYKRFGGKEKQVQPPNASTKAAPPPEPAAPPKPVAHSAAETKPAAGLARPTPAKATPPPQAPAAITPKPRRKMLTFKVDESVVTKMRHVVYWYGAKNQQQFLEGMLLQCIDDMENEQERKN